MARTTSAPTRLTAAQAAADRGRAHLHGRHRQRGRAQTCTSNGFTVHTQLDEATLQQISQITGGTYYNAESEEDLLNIYDNLNPQLVIKPEKMEVTPLFAGAGILVLLIGGAFSLLWFGRAAVRRKSRVV